MALATRLSSLAINRAGIAREFRKHSLAIPRLALKLGITSLKATAELIPAIRMSPTKRRILPKNMGAGFLGAEIATWWALSPSLLPRPWWVTAANLAVLQAVGHVCATATSQVLPRPKTHKVNATIYNSAHVVLGAITATTVAIGITRQRTQATFMGLKHRGMGETALGISVGTAGYGLLLLAGELAQHTAGHIRSMTIPILPLWVRWLSWPIAITTLGILVLTIGDRVVLRRMLIHAARNAAYLNQLVFPGTEQPWEPERSGSPWSHERWGAVGSQGRAVLSGGPRKDDIIQVTGSSPDSTHEPIRIFIGMVQGRTMADQVHLAIAEMHRTGALRRDTIIITTSTGTGWITDWSSATTEFLSAGNCVTVSMQYSHLPSALSWYRDNDAPIKAAKMLIDAVLHELEQLPASPNRPKLYLAGESLGAYGTAEAYGSVRALLDIADGIMLSGTPRFSTAMRSLIASRDTGSSERLPVIDGGKHIRIVAGTADLFVEKHWHFPRMIIAQHASDPIVWWDAELFIKKPEWYQHQWIPFVSGWQIMLDLLISVDAPGGYGHNYHDEFIDYWSALFDLQPVSPPIRRAIGTWIRKNSIKR